ncbi:iron compound ABC transporter substrate-binding protein [Paenibacillus terrae HPL-003]|uniref:Iron compound ABC transporter substrate-binding protein n=1 Tax=Paenibacillus terrae (strain HPL-003) TaxID=985665 RepID=G7W0C3_PAETH|nr:ABC transporter substrate-binding protein [Paenibacillus terrae]AET59141.1 iron compound ABC transporter substrate-binding protein [Paenibacillus terrae HPL-003]
MKRNGSNYSGFKRSWVGMVLILCMVMLSACGQAADNKAADTKAADKGEQTVSADSRIASMSIHLTNNLLALGITPAGSVIGGDVKDFLPHVKDRLQNTRKLGVVTDPDMEDVLDLQPDHIFLDKKYSGTDVAKYEKIAPTEVFDLDEGTWRDQLKKIAVMVKHEAQADAFLKDYDAQQERVKKLIHQKIGDGTVMAIRVTAKEVRVMGMKRPVGPLLYQDLGLKPAKGVEKINKAYQVVSQEVLPDYDADAIFVIISKGADAQKVYTQLEGNAVWQGLKAVKQGHVYMLDGQPWLDYSAMGHKIALDNAEQLFSK